MSKITKSSKITWEAEEYIQRDKNTGWYIGFTFIVLALIALSIFLQWWTFTALVVVSAIALLLYVVRPPRKIKYTLTSKGLEEGEKLYKFEDYKSFGILQQDKNFAIVLTPRKRFSPSVTVYFPAADGEDIVDLFGLNLPMEEVKLDVLDKIVKLLRI